MRTYEIELPDHPSWGHCFIYTGDRRIARRQARRYRGRFHVSRGWRIAK